MATGHCIARLWNDSGLVTVSVAIRQGLCRYLAAAQGVSARTPHSECAGQWLGCYPAQPHACVLLRVDSARASGKTCSQTPTPRFLTAASSSVNKGEFVAT
eukprot:1264201-Rhodomonas_salina.2